MNKNDLKVELRSALFMSSDDSRVLEYRISPEQDLTYYKEVKLFGLTLFKLRREYSCKWIMPFTYWTSDIIAQFHYKPDIHPIWLDSMDDFENLKQTIHTYGDIRNLIKKMNAEAVKEHKEMRKEYLNRNPKYIY